MSLAKGCGAAVCQQMVAHAGGREVSVLGLTWKDSVGVQTQLYYSSGGAVSMSVTCKAILSGQLRTTYPSGDGSGAILRCVMNVLSLERVWARVLELLDGWCVWRICLLPSPVDTTLRGRRHREEVRNIEGDCSEPRSATLCGRRRGEYVGHMQGKTARAGTHNLRGRR